MFSKSRRFLALILSVALVFGLCATASATERVSDGPFTYENLEVYRILTGDTNQVSATIIFDTSDSDPISYSGTITITYTYATSTDANPNTYMTYSESVYIRKNQDMEATCEVDLGGNYVLIDATAHFTATISLTSSTVDFHPNDLYICIL